MKRMNDATMLYRCPGSDAVGNPPINVTMIVVDAPEVEGMLEKGWYRTPQDADAGVKAGAAEAQRKQAIDAVNAMNDPKQLADYAKALGMSPASKATVEELKSGIIATLTPKS